MADWAAISETISEARAAIRRAARIDAGRSGMEGDLESADSRLEEAQDAIRRGMHEWAREAVGEALEELDTDQTPENPGHLADAVRRLSEIQWD